MYKDGGIYKNCLLEQTRISLCISQVQPDHVYFLIHALLTFRTVIACAVYKMFNQESSDMLIDDVPSVVSVETLSMMSVEPSSMMSTSSIGKKRKKK